MKILAMAVALAIALTWPTLGEAQSRKSKAKGAQTSQKYVRHAKAPRTTGTRPCAARVSYIGCLGWDPDPNVRSMMRMDAGVNDY